MASQKITRTGSSPRPPRRFRLTTPAPSPPRSFRSPVDIERLKVRVGRNGLFWLMFFALVMMFSPYVLVFFLDLDERELVRDLSNNPEAMAMLHLLIICKMVGLGTIFTCMPLIKHWYIDDPLPEPAPRPEKASRTHAKAPTLSSTQRTLLAHGHAGVGHVIEVRWPKVMLQYRDMRGGVWARWLRAHRTVESRPVVGDTLPLLLDPLCPGEVVAPSLLDVTFETPEPFDDQRTEPSPELQPLPDDLTTSALNVPLYTTLHPIPASAVARFRRRLVGHHHQSPEIGSLSISAESRTLIQTLQGGQDEVSLALDKPFGVDATVWLISDEMAELTLTLRQVGAPPSSTSLKIRSEVPQMALSSALPLKQSQAPYLASEDFEILWQALSFHAAAHGEELAVLASFQGETRGQTRGVRESV